MWSENQLFPNYFWDNEISNIPVTIIANDFLLQCTSNKSTRMVQSIKIISCIIPWFASNYWFMQLISLRNDSSEIIVYWYGTFFTCHLKKNLKTSYVNSWWCLKFYCSSIFVKYVKITNKNKKLLKYSQTQSWNKIIFS